MTFIYLVRHAESTGAQPDGPLTEKGHDQARELSVRLAELKPNAAFSSPYVRAIDTIRPYCDAIGMKIEAKPDLRERKLKPHDIWLSNEDYIFHTRRSFVDRDHVLPDGESLNATANRAKGALQEIAHLGHTSTIVASHGNFMASLLSEMDGSFGYSEFAAIKNPHIFRLEWDGQKFIRFTDMG